MVLFATGHPKGISIPPAHNRSLAHDLDCANVCVCASVCSPQVYTHQYIYIMICIYI
jgi:hypothetical protein